MTALALLNRDQIIAQIAQGEFLDRVADQLGIAAPNISKHLANDPEYQLAREVGAELRLHRAASKLQSIAEKDEKEILELDRAAASALGNLARAREASFRAAAWFAEREFPHRWGQKQEVTHTVVPVLNITLSPLQASESKGITVDCQSTRVEE